MALVGGIDIDSENVTEFVVGVGETVKLCAPPAYPPAVDPSTASAEGGFKHLNGWTILRPELGDFEGNPPGTRCVFYKHKKSGQQIIQYSSVGIYEISFYAVLAGITVHDHASVAQGGPAFATYYTEIADNREQEGG
jgi:hypothetical protein